MTEVALLTFPMANRVQKRKPLMLAGALRHTEAAGGRLA